VTPHRPEQVSRFRTDRMANSGASAAGMNGSGAPISCTDGWVIVCAPLTLTLTSSAASRLRGEAMLISPFGTWGPDGIMLGPWSAGFAIEPGRTTTLEFGVDVPPTARPGSRWWAMVKVAWFGSVLYTLVVPLRVRCYSQIEIDSW
jgi:hypothetical protein